MARTESFGFFEMSEGKKKHEGHVKTLQIMTMGAI